MDQSGGSCQQQGMIDDGFSSEEEVYVKKVLDTEENNKILSEQKIKDQIKFILPPPQQIKSKSYSLAPDNATGWGFKIQQPNPIPITFGNRYIDNLVNLMLANPVKKYSIVYLGPRYQNTFYAWRDKPIKFPYSHINLPKNIKYKKRPFLGQNPQIQNAIYFDSTFQSGNMDVAIKVNSHEYDIFLRVDSNTRGHFSWFNFTVKNLIPSQKYRINICNLERGFCLYSRGMKPYIKSLKIKNDDWKQAGLNVTYMRKQIRFARQYDVEQKKQFALSFDIETQQQNDEIQISYCVPYTLSKMLKLIECIKIQTERKNFLKQTNLCMSLGGLPIPLLTITEFQKDEKLKQKKCVIMCGRMHPGQSNGSYMMEGFLKFICGQSRTAYQLRKNIVFKIVPMMNPDGVVLGNYRTGLSGKDFNRQYRSPDKDIFPEVYFFKKLVTQSKMTFKNNLFMFLDLHGHSQKKNVFAYGPEFPMAQKFYYQARIFAKMLEKQNRMFRYHSCVFKISQCKLATARAILLKKINIPMTYTIQASNGFYHDKQLLISIPFVAEQWIKMGVSIGKTINQYVDCMLSSEKIKQDRQKAKFEASMSKNQKHKTKSTSSSPIKKQSSSSLISARQDAKIKKIYEQILQQENQGPGDPVSDDNISEGSSDKQDEKDDLSKKQLQTLFHSIKNNNKLGKNKNKKGKVNKIDLSLFQNDAQKESDQDQKRQDMPKSFRIKKTIDHLQKMYQKSERVQQVFIAKQGSFLTTFSNPSKYLTERKQKSSKQFGQLQGSSKIINYKFQEQKKNHQYLQTISIFPNYGSKNRNTISISEGGNSTDKIHRSILISNLGSSPRSIKIHKNQDLDRTINSFSMRKKDTLQKKLQQVGMQKFQNSYIKFTKTSFYPKNQHKNTTVSFSRRIFDRSNALL